MDSERAPQRPRILDNIDAYLAHYGKTNERAVAHVVKVLTKYDHMVSLAADRAIEELYIPDNVVQMFPRGWTINYGGDNAG